MNEQEEEQKDIQRYREKPEDLDQVIEEIENKYVCEECGTAMFNVTEEEGKSLECPSCGGKMVKKRN